MPPSPLDHRFLRIEPEGPDRCTEDEQCRGDDEGRLPGTELDENAKDVTPVAAPTNATMTDQ
jgi:hypothetical protein